MLPARWKGLRYRPLPLNLEVLEVSSPTIHPHADFPHLPLDCQPNPAHRGSVSRGQTWPGEGQ